jgi:hypothetical protein
MRSTRLLVSIVAVGAAASLGPGGCSCNSSSSGSPPAQDQNNDAASDDSGESTPTPEGGSEASTVVEAGAVAEGGTTYAEAGGDGAIAPPAVTYNVCPDNGPTNTSFANAYPLTLDSSGFADLGAGILQGSDDWFSWVAPKHDPAHVWVSYTVPTGDTTTLQLENENISSNDVGYDDSARTTNSQTLETYFETTNQGTFYSDISSNGSACTSFDYYVDALFCTDQYEDNDYETTGNESGPAPIALQTTAYSAPTTWATATANFSATINDLDPDFYSFVSPLHDPMSATVTYTEPTNETATLNIEVDNAATSDQGYDDSSRSTDSQTLNVVWEGNAQATYILDVQSGNSSSNGVCSSYTVALNGLWCTDEYEDNDTEDAAVTLPDTSSTPTTATISSLDPDYYIIPNPSTNGSCTVVYTVPTTSTQQLNLEVDSSGSQSDINYDDSPTMTSTTSTTATWTLTVNWTSEDSPEYLDVSASAKDCTTYTISCTSN